MKPSLVRWGAERDEWSCQALSPGPKGRMRIREKESKEGKRRGKERERESPRNYRLYNSLRPTILLHNQQRRKGSLMCSRRCSCALFLYTYMCTRSVMYTAHLRMAQAGDIGSTSRRRKRTVRHNRAGGKMAWSTSFFPSPPFLFLSFFLSLSLCIYIRIDSTSIYISCICMPG